MDWDLTTLDYGERGTVLVVPDSEALAVAAAQSLISTSETAAAQTRRALVALSGGSTPKRMGQLLAEAQYRDRVKWENLEIFWGDERWVPLDSPESNAGEAKRGFLDHVPIPGDQVHLWDTGAENPEASAAVYADAIRIAMQQNNTGAFDLILLGMGDDGHTASLFPGTAAIHESGRLTVGHEVPKLDATRLTFTPALINAAAKVIFLVGGAGKADMLHTVLDGPIDVDRYPSQVVRPASGDLEWLVDTAAAASLERKSNDG
jgi:6-phosphogluconolactonase